MGGKKPRQTRHKSRSSRAEAANGKWYRAGLRFECTQCGKCCTGEPGYVWVETQEAEKIAEFLDISLNEFHVRYTRNVSGRISLIELQNGNCVFYDPNTCRCRVYPVRPTQCVTFPFWDSNLQSPEAWAETASRCPGCNLGPVHSFTTIEKLRKRRSV